MGIPKIIRRMSIRSDRNGIGNGDTNELGGNERSSWSRSRSSSVNKSIGTNSNRNSQFLGQPQSHPTLPDGAAPAVAPAPAPVPASPSAAVSPGAPGAPTPPRGAAAASIPPGGLVVPPAAPVTPDRGMAAADMSAVSLDSGDGRDSREGSAVPISPGKRRGSRLSPVISPIHPPSSYNDPGGPASPRASLSHKRGGRRLSNASASAMSTSPRSEFGAGPTPVSPTRNAAGASTTAVHGFSPEKGGAAAADANARNLPPTPVSPEIGPEVPSVPKSGSLMPGGTEPVRTQPVSSAPSTPGGTHKPAANNTSPTAVPAAAGVTTTTSADAPVLSSSPDSVHANDGSKRDAVPDFPALPEAPAPRVFGHGWSASHKVPNISDYGELQKKHAAEAEEYARIVEARAAAQGRHGSEDSSSSTLDSANKEGENQKEKAHPNEAATEKQRLMDQMNAAKEKPTERFRKHKKGERRVRDPITGGEIIIKDIDKHDFDSTRPRALGSNVLYHPFPPPAPSSIQAIVDRIRQLQYALGAGVFALWFFTAFGNGFYKFFWRTCLAGAVAFGLVSLASLLERNVEKEIDAVRLDLGRARGEAFSPPFPESTEWLNGLIKLVWGLIDPAVFVPMADMVEDILQQSLPNFVDAVRITDVGQGTNPLRIMSIRALPDQPGDVGYPRTDWIDQGEGVGLKDTAGKEIKEDQAGDYYNFEVAFSYAALPGQGATQRAKNIHMLIEFFLGAYDWFHIPVPIWIQIEEIYGIVRLRAQFIPEPPFIRNVTFALCGVPSVEVSAIPMSRHLPNVLDLPFVSGFVKSGIAAGTAELCVPKSMTINLKDMLSGAAVGDTRAIGVFVITIHYCVDLSAQDNNGKSDPYIVLAYAKYGRPLYSTRIIIEDLNPVYEETAVLLLTLDEVKSKEDLVCMLWDSDKFSADDLVGRVQIPVEELMAQPNKTIRREDGLKGFEDSNDMPGTLVWSVGYYEKVPLRKHFERPLTAEEEKNQPAQPSPASKEMLPYDVAPNPARNDLPPPPPDVTRTHPDPEFPSGVLSIVLHQVNNLERQQLSGKSGDDREGEAGQDTDDPSQQTNNLPSGYGEFIINDELVYRSRVKQYTTNPYFEAGTEVFIRDFTTTEVRIVIRDSRLREADPIMGIITVQLADIFAEASTVTETYPIQSGVGFGKANISFAFRSVQAQLPVNLRGWDVGTLIVSNVRFTPNKESKIPPKGMSLRVYTHEATEVMKRKEADVDGDTVIWDDEDLYLPVYSRYQSSVVFEFGSTGFGQIVGKGKPEAMAVLWLQDLTDNIEGEVELPVIVGENFGCLRQNVIEDQTLKHHKFEIVGTVVVRMVFSAGLDLEHEKLRLSQSRRHAFQAYMAIEGEAEVARRQQSFMDDGVIDRHEKREMDKAHRRALESRGRGLAQVGMYRSIKWMSRGIKDRLPGRKKTREPTVQTEA